MGTMKVVADYSFSLEKKRLPENGQRRPELCMCSAMQERNYLDAGDMHMPVSTECSQDSGIHRVRVG